MLRFALLRVLYMVVVMLATSLLVFVLSRLTGDPRNLYLSSQVTPEQYEAWGKEMGLDRPLVVQYLVWLGRAVRGDFGKSLRDQRPVTSVIAERVPATLELAVSSFVLALLIGIPLGVLSAVRRGSAWDYFGRGVALLGQALPAFWTGLVLIVIFSVELNWLPTGRRGGIDHYVLPAITLGWGALSGFLRLTRSAMLEVLDSQYVTFARAKGVRQIPVIWKHAFKNALIPPLTFAGLILAGYIGGTVVTETVFAWPGVGRLAVQAILSNDFPLITGIVILATGIYVVVNFFVDLSYAYVDPRIRY